MATGSAPATETPRLVRGVSLFDAVASGELWVGLAIGYVALFEIRLPFVSEIRPVKIRQVCSFLFEKKNSV